MTPIPRIALPVVELVRKLAFRPKSPPTMRSGGLRWLVFERHGWCCPLGLIEGMPGQPDIECAASAFDLSPTRFRLFIRWWDSLRDPDAAEAFEAIFPKDMTTRKGGEAE